MLTLIIVDDEAHVRESLAYMVEHFASGFKVIGSFADVPSAINAIALREPDIVLLDVEIGDDNAFSILKHFPKPSFKIVFITAYQHYAIQAFRISAVDYLMKPVDPDQLIEALDRSKDSIAQQKLSEKIDCLMHNVAANIKKSKRVVLKTSDSIHVVNLDDVMYCEAQRSYTTFYLTDKSKIVVSCTLGEYEDLFIDFDFIRVHQSYLLNINYIKRYEKADGGNVILKDNTHLPVATRKKEHLLDVLKRL